MQKKKGISLIVLVITIIVMIILAAAIILSLNNAGIIGNANKAVDESNMANIKTAADLAYAEYLIEHVELSEGQKLEDYLTDNLVKNGTIKGKDKDYYIKVIDGEITVIKEGSVADKYFDGDIKIGDYVKYNPIDGVNDPENIIYTSEQEKNGYKDQEFSLTESYNNEEYGWQVMGVGKGGELLLLSEDYIQPTVNGISDGEKYYFCFLGDVNGEINKTREAYLNAPGELNNICAIFGKGYGATGARSITVEDVNKITGYDPDKASFANDELREYNNEITYYWKNDEGTIKVWYEGSNGLEGYFENSDGSNNHTTFEWYEGSQYRSQEVPEDLKIDEKKKITTLKNSNYRYYPETLADVSGTGSGKVKPGTLEYDLLFTDKREDVKKCCYWFASISMQAYSKNVYFGIRNVYLTGLVRSRSVFWSSGEGYGPACGVRAVVSLDSSIVLEKIQDTEAADIYSIQNN